MSGPTRAEPMDSATAVSVYNSLSATYEQNIGYCTSPVASYMLELTAPLIRPGTSILDNACGPGVLTRHLLERFGNVSDLKLSAADAAPAMIDLLKNTFSERGWGEKVRAEVNDGMNLCSFSDGEFDLSYTNMGLFFFPEPTQGAKEILRTLKPGGTAVVSCWKYMGQTEAWNEMKTKTFPGSAPVYSPIFHDWYNPFKLREVLEGVGLVIEELSQCPSWFAAGSVEELARVIAKAQKAFAGEKEDEEMAVKGLIEVLGKEGAVEERPEGVGCRMDAWVAVCKRPVE